jgi:hypothetical protein
MVSRSAADTETGSVSVLVNKITLSQPLYGVDKFNNYCKIGSCKSFYKTNEKVSRQKFV